MDGTWGLVSRVWKSEPRPRLFEAIHVHACESKTHSGLALTKSTERAGKKLNKIKARVSSISPGHMAP